MKYRTDEVLNGVKDGTIKESEVDFISREEALAMLRADIEGGAFSLNRLAAESAVHPSQLCEFLQGNKNLNRDKVLAVLINLGYRLDEVQSMLGRLGVPSLYVRNKRDFQIAAGIRNGKSLYEIDCLLSEKNIKTLGQYAKDKGAGTS